MNKYAISVYKGAIMKDDLIIATQIIEGDYEITSKKVIKASKQLVEKCNFKFDKWYRLLETTKNVRIDIDFGDYSYFVKVELIDNKHPFVY